MTSSRPYLLRAIYEWLSDNGLTPYILVDAYVEGVEVPQRFVEDGKIILNIAAEAVAGLIIGNDIVEFSARFSGKQEHIIAPVNSISAIYAHENGRGMVFNESDIDNDPSPTPPRSPGPGPSRFKREKPKAKPHLTVVK